jgi:hypothetical protein
MHVTRKLSRILRTLVAKRPVPRASHSSHLCKATVETSLKRHHNLLDDLLLTSRPSRLLQLTHSTRHDGALQYARRPGYILRCPDHLRGQVEIKSTIRTKT